MLGDYLRQLIRSNRNQWGVRLVAKASEKYLRAWHNESHFSFDQNGEQFSLSVFAKWKAGAPGIIWDVGAHHGEWADEANKILPSSHIVSFEIVKPIADRIAQRHLAARQFTLETFGFSDHEGEVEVTYNLSHDTTSSISPRFGHEYFSEFTSTIKLFCRVTTIDAYIASGKEPPEYLKIDVEGHEPSVLMGGEKLLSSSDAPAMIQFEYGDTWLPKRNTLQEVQMLLESKGYSVGRLYPNHVEFKSYAYDDDHFRMGNMIAVRDTRLKSMLSQGASSTL